MPSGERASVIERIMRALNARFVDELRQIERVQAGEFLLCEQERMHNDRTRMLVTIPSEFADADSAAHASEAIARFHQINQSALASRFVIETAARCAGNGHRPLSLARYDELLAIAEQIIGLGFMGDAHRHGLSDAEMRIEAPGRLALGPRDEFRTILNSHLERNAQSFVHQDALAEWSSFIADRDLAYALTRSEEARVFEIEFGIPLAGFVGGSSVSENSRHHSICRSRCCRFPRSKETSSLRRRCQLGRHLRFSACPL